MNCLFWALTGFLLILGVAQLWEVVLLRWYRPKLPLYRRELIFLSASAGTVEQQLHYISLTSAAMEIVLVDAGLSEEARELCLHFCEEHGAFRLMSEEQAKREIFSGDFPPKELESEENP